MKDNRTQSILDTYNIIWKNIFRSRIAVQIRNNPVVRMFNEKIRGQSSVNLDQLKSSPSLGYGKVSIVVWMHMFMYWLIYTND